MRCNSSKAFFPIRRNPDPIPLKCELVGEFIAQVTLVFNNQNRMHSVA